MHNCSLKGGNHTPYHNLVKDLTDAGQLKLKVGPHHFASIKDDEMLVVDTLGIGSRFYQIPRANDTSCKKNGINAAAQLYPLYHELN